MDADGGPASSSERHSKKLPFDQSLITITKNYGESRHGIAFFARDIIDERYPLEVASVSFHEFTNSYNEELEYNDANHFICWNMPGGIMCKVETESRLRTALKAMYLASESSLPVCDFCIQDAFPSID